MLYHHEEICEVREQKGTEKTRERPTNVSVPLFSLLPNWKELESERMFKL